MRAPVHTEQEKRLETLAGYDILDTPQETDFDDIVELASKICDAPISLISLVDENRQWFKARVGFEDTETPIDSSICSYAILQDTLMEIPDLLKDPRTSDNPLTQGDGGIRFYAGVKLNAPNGMPIGSLCVIDTKPRELTEFQRDALRILSKQVVKQFELRLALRNQVILQAEMDHRVKNSLQSIASVVRIYSRTIDDANAQQALAAVQRRIDAVAMLHAELQSADKSDTVRTSDYMPRVITLLQAGAPENITIDSTIDPVLMSSEDATNLAMITSEFVANSIKHGFPDAAPGTINIEFQDLGNHRYRLECRDNGIGSSSRKMDSPTRTQGIGTRLVAAAASSLGGTTETEINEDGSHLILQFEIAAND